MDSFRKRFICRLFSRAGTQKAETVISVDRGAVICYMEDHIVSVTIHEYLRNTLQDKEFLAACENKEREVLELMSRAGWYLSVFDEEEREKELHRYRVVHGFHGLQVVNINME